MITEQLLIAAPKRTVAPTVLPITLDEAKWAVGILDDDTVNAPLTDKMYEAVDIVERDARRQLMPQTWQWKLPYFPWVRIELPKVPVASVTFVKYYINSVLTTWSASNYQTDLVTEPCVIRPVSTVSWPATDYRIDAVQIEWVAGYASAAALRAERASAKGAVLWALCHLWNGCDLMTDNYKAMIDRLRP